MKKRAEIRLRKVDLYICHMWDYQTPLYDTMAGLKRIVTAGRARYIGIANCFAWQLDEANALAEQDQVIIERVAELANKRKVSMTEIALARLLTKAEAPRCRGDEALPDRGRGSC